MPILENGQLLGLDKTGWVIGHMGGGPRNTDDFGIKWMRHGPGLAGDGSWSICLDPNTKTLSVLISGHFKIHFREHEGGPETEINLKEPGDYILFQPPTQHCSEAITESVFLTVRWPSTKDDCGSQGAVGQPQR